MHKIKNKNLFKVLLTILIGCVIAYIVYMIVIFIVSGINGNYSEEKMNYYKSKENREKYFNDHEKDFNKIANAFQKYSDINSIKYDNEDCTSIEKVVVTEDNVSLCVKEESNQIDEIKKIRIGNAIKNLSLIVEIERSPIMDEDANYIYNKLRFFIISSWRGAVYYDYCLLPNYCEIQSSEQNNNNYKVNYISDKWSSIYNDNSSV